MSRATASILSILAVAACVAPSTTNSAAAPSARDVEERDVAAAIATYTVRAYQPVIVAADSAAAYTSLPALANTSAPVRVVQGEGDAYTTIVGPYRDRETGEAKVTRISVRTEGGRQVASYYTRTLGGGIAERGEYTAQPALKVVAN